MHFAERLYREQPISGPGIWNRMDYRPLEGFVLAITPFNFTAIAGNLPTAPALMGNTVVWKPSRGAMLSAHFVQRLLQAAGLPDGVVNLVYGPAPEIVGRALDDPGLAGVHYTGSTEVFQGLWRQIGERIARYRAYPRVVGETGGKDFIVVHASADLDAAVTAIVRGAFEYQGQKCSAASRLFAPRSAVAGAARATGRRAGADPDGRRRRPVQLHGAPSSTTTPSPGCAMRSRRRGPRPARGWWRVAAPTTRSAGSWSRR